MKLCDLEAMKRVFVFGIVFCMAASIVIGQKNFNIEVLAQVAHPIETNDIWGYVDDDGVEYAVIGTEQDCRIYSLSDPQNPELVTTISGATSIWRDFKSYGNYIYQITQRGDDGLTIIDMTMAPDSVSSILFKPSLTVGSNTEDLSTCHNLYIDEENGLAYLAGCNNGVGGILIFDLTLDPLSPTFIGAQNERYSHDVVAKGDTLFSSEINEGNLGIYDITDKANPVLISRTRTSSTFTHNAWYSDDGNFVFTTDERANAYVDAYDIRDIESPLRIDQYRPNSTAGTIPHNTHYKDGFLVTSWYTDGVIVVDAHRPDNLVKVAQYDTYTEPRTGFQGCWGAYPFLPSGLLLVSDLASGLFVMEPTYVRASYLEGNIVDAATGSPVNAAVVSLSDCELTTEESRANGEFKTGTADAGTYQVVISHPDFESDTITVDLASGVVTEVSVRLVRRSSVFTVVGQIIDQSGEVIEGAQLIIQNDNRTEMTETNRDGFYRALLTEDSYEFYVAAWGYKGKLVKLAVADPRLEDIVLEVGYEDDFFVDLGWQVSGNSRTGSWERVIPKPTFFRGNNANPGIDVDNDLNSYCYVTGNNDATPGADDVDDGTTTLTSPPINVDKLQNAIIEITPWFFNDGGDSPFNDTMKVYLIHGQERFLTHFISRDVALQGRWLDPLKIYVDSIFKRAKEVQIQIEISDGVDSGHLVEGGVDRFRMYEGPLPNYPSVQEEIDIVVAPSPNDGYFYIDVFTDQTAVELNIYNLSGKHVYRESTPELELALPHLATGLYVVEVEFESGVKSSILFSKL